MTNPEPKNPSRQVRRALSRRKEFTELRQRFGGFTDRGGFHWPVDMPRRIARKIALYRARLNAA